MATKQLKLGIWPKTKAKVKAAEKQTGLKHVAIADRAMDALLRELGVGTSRNGKEGSAGRKDSVALAGS